MKTGRELFESVLETLDNSVTIKSIVSANASEIVFTVCANKWLRKDLSFEDKSGNGWNVASFNAELQQVTALIPSAGLNLLSGQQIFIQKPVFRSGTPMRMEGEWNLEENAGVYPTTPIIWLLETISGRGFNRKSSIAKKFDYTFYALDQTNIVDWLNADRHKEGVKPMTALADAVIEAFENYFGVWVDDDFQIKEFNVFGKETQDGFISYLISKNLSGVEYKPRVSASREACEC